MIRNFCRNLVILALSAMTGTGLPLTARAEFPPGGPFGSARLLHALWAPAQLAGSDGDRRVGTRRLPDLAGPDPGGEAPELPPVPRELRGCIRQVRPGPTEQVVALTFDLCELSDQVAGYDNGIVNLLRAGQVPATFFAGGHWLKTHREAGLQLLADPLFEIGNHGWTHGNLAVLDPLRGRDQILWTQVQYRHLRDELSRRAATAGLAEEMAAVPELPRLFRLPYGRADREALELLGDLGLPVVLWSITLDENAPVGQTSHVAAEAARRVRPGAILLLHANGVPKHTTAILTELVETLQRSGYRFVTVSSLLQLGPAVTSEECYFERPGDNLKLDEIYGDGTRHPLLRR